jgi:peptidoglycan hydrolase-like protein with peptidoglycan-binding domain
VVFQKLQHISPNGVADRLVWDRLEKRDYPLIAYRMVTVRQGNKGRTVRVVQHALRVGADGIFGRRTAAAVKVVQAKSRLRRTGVVSGWTWVAIERQMRR